METAHWSKKTNIIPAFLMTPTQYNVSAERLPLAVQDFYLS